MKAIILDSYGGPEEVLRVGEVDEPTMADGEVLVEVHAASVNAADWQLVRGTPLIARLRSGLRTPKVRVPGSDLAGTVRSIGRNVAWPAVGEQVFGSSFMAGWGAFAELVAVPESRLVAKPASITFEQAAAVPLAGTTALQALRDHGRLAAGQRVLIVGASGGVGTFAVQIAKALGAEVTAVCSSRNLDLVRSLGADHGIDYKKVDFARGPGRFDLIIQAAGSHGPAACRRALVRGGALVQISNDSPNRWLGSLDRSAAAALLSPIVSQRFSTFTVQPNRRDLVFLAGLVETGQLNPVIDRTYPLHDIGDAVRHVEEGHTRGKAIVSVASSIHPSTISACVSHGAATHRS